MSSDAEAVVPISVIAPMTRMGERVAVVEQQCIALKEDSQVIRRSLHEINNHMQSFIRNEEQCAAQLRAQAAAMLTHSDALKGLDGRLDALHAAKSHSDGAAWAYTKLISTIVSGVTTLAALATLVAFLLGRG